MAPAAEGSEGGGMSEVEAGAKIDSHIILMHFDGIAAIV